MIPAEWFDRLRPLSGIVLVERDEVPAERGGLILPKTYTQGTQSMTGRVTHSGSPYFSPGDRVMLSSGIVRKIQLGDIEPRLLFVCRERQIQAKIYLDAEIESYGENFLGRSKDREDLYLQAESLPDEGLPSAHGEDRSRVLPADNLA